MVYQGSAGEENHDPESKRKHSNDNKRGHQLLPVKQNSPGDADRHIDDVQRIDDGWHDIWVIIQFSTFWSFPENI